MVKRFHTANYGNGYGTTTKFSEYLIFNIHYSITTVRIAILDLGTNTFHLLIADVNGKKYSQLFKSKAAVKLGEGSIHKNKIALIPFWRGVKTLQHYKGIIEKYKAEKVFASQHLQFEVQKTGLNL